jgi:hypothetical protein
VGFFLTASVAFVTASFAPDRDRCALLSRSLDALAPSVQHYIVVDEADRRYFASLESSRTTLLTKEEVLPLWLQRVNMRRFGLRSDMWLQTRGKPIRGWLVQQLVKLALAERLDEDVLVHVDSDVVLVRPFDAASIVDADGNVRLCVDPGAIDAALPDHVRWHRNAERLLGLQPAPIPLPDYITSVVPWRRDDAVALLDHIERTTGRSWFRAVAGSWDASEYTLYGRFAIDVLGGRGHFTGPSLSRDYWTREVLSPSELDDFLEGLGPDQIAVNLTAKAGMDPAIYSEVIERRWMAAQHT